MNKPELPKMLDASFLYGQKRYEKKINNFRSSEQQIDQEITYSEVLAENTDGKDKIKRLIQDEYLTKEFLVAANQKNPDLQEYFYLPLLCIFIEPKPSKQICNQDIEFLLSNFGQALKIVNKDSMTYVMMRNIVECWLTVKILNNTQIEIPGETKQGHILKVQICFEDDSSHHIFQFHHEGFKEERFILDITNDKKWLDKVGENFRYVSIFEIDMEGYLQEFRIKERIMGIKGCNIIRIYYLVEKGLAFMVNSQKEEGRKDLDIKVIVNDVDRGIANQLIIMSNIWNKFTLAQRYANELFAQIKEEFKFFQDHQLQSLQESRVKRMDKFFLPLEIQYSYDNDQ